MPEQMVTMPIFGTVDVPLPTETSRYKPDQVGNVAGVTQDELTERYIKSGERATEGPIEKLVVFWLGGMSCDGCTIATLGATAPALEELLTGALPGVPHVVLHHYQTSIESGDHFIHSMEKAAKGELGAPYVLVYEGSIPDEHLTVMGEPWAAEGSLPTWSPPEQRASIPTSQWVRWLAPGAMVSIAIGTCATWGGIPASAGNPTGSMSLMDFLGQDYRSAAGLPVVNVPGCAPIGDNFTETVTLLLLYLNGHGPLPEFDELGRPYWLFRETVHRQCPRGAYYEEGTFAAEFGDRECLAEIGCWGPVVNCNITERGAEGHQGGCMVSGGACIGCTMPGFPDKFTPFYRRPPMTTPATTLARFHGALVRPFRIIAQQGHNREPRWHDEVPSGWAMESAKPTPTHKAYEAALINAQYLRFNQPGRQKPVEKYRSGYVVPAEVAYGERYHELLPEQRAKIARERGAPRRPELDAQGTETLGEGD